MVLGLKKDGKLVHFQSILQLVFHFYIIQKILHDSGVVIPYGILSGTFGLSLKHYNLGTIDEFQRSICRHRIFRHTNRHFNMQLTAVCKKWFLQSIYYFFIHFMYVILIFGIINGNAENISAKMRYADIFIRKLIEELTKGLHQHIPHNDPQAVIDLTEIIDVNKHNRNRGILRFCLPYLFSKKHNEMISVMKTCKGIKISHEFQFIILHHVLCHVLKTNHLISGFSQAVINDCGIHIDIKMAFLHPCTYITSILTGPLQLKDLS